MTAIELLESHARLCRFLADKIDHDRQHESNCLHCRLLTQADEADDLVSLEGVEIRRESLSGLAEIL